MEAFTYKGISAGKYIEGEIEAINDEEASFKLKEQKIIITNLVKSKKKKDENKITEAENYLRIDIYQRPSHFSVSMPLQEPKAILIVSTVFRQLTEAN